MELEHETSNLNVAGSSPVGEMISPHRLMDKPYGYEPYIASSNLAGGILKVIHRIINRMWITFLLQKYIDISMNFYYNDL